MPSSARPVMSMAAATGSMPGIELMMAKRRASLGSLVMRRAISASSRTTWRLRLVSRCFSSLLRNAAVLAPLRWRASACRQGLSSLPVDQVHDFPDQIAGHGDFGHVERGLAKWRTTLEPILASFS